jgi:hypothetical protein
MTLSLPPPSLDFAAVADVRAHGGSWIAASNALGLHVDDLRGSVTASPAEYRKVLLRAQRDVLDETFAEALLAARMDLRSEDRKLRQTAYEVVTRTYTSLHRHRDKVKVKTVVVDRWDNVPDDQLKAMAAAWPYVRDRIVGNPLGGDEGEPDGGCPPVPPGALPRPGSVCLARQLSSTRTRRPAPTGSWRSPAW